MAYSNSYICAVSTPTLGLYMYVQSIALGELIELSSLKTVRFLQGPVTATHGIIISVSKSYRL